MKFWGGGGGGRKLNLGWKNLRAPLPLYETLFN